MTEKSKELKYICEGAAFDFIKNTQKDSEAGFEYSRFMISSRPYIKKNNMQSDKALTQCWETHYRY